LDVLAAPRWQPLAFKTPPLGIEIVFKAQFERWHPLSTSNIRRLDGARRPQVGEVRFAARARRGRNSLAHENQSRRGRIIRRVENPKLIFN
jgi:hypothetical protein